MMAPKVLLLVCAAAAAAVSVSEASLTGAIIASYFDSGSGNWAKLNDAIRNSGRASSMYAILNENNGIVSGTSSAWQTVAKNIHNAGGKVLVYVDTCNVPTSQLSGAGLTNGCSNSKQGGASASVVAGYVKNWIKYLGGDTSLIDGVFLDDTPVSGSNAGNVAAIAKAIRGLSGMSGKFIVANQGDNSKPSSDVLKSGVVDVSVQQEGDSTTNSNTDSSKAAMILNSISSSSNAQSKAKSAGSNGFGYFYATSSSQYGSLPSYIGDLLKCIGNGSCTHN